MKHKIDIKKIAELIGVSEEVYVETITGSTFAASSEAIVANLLDGYRLTGKQDAFDVIATHRKYKKIEVRNICKTGYVFFCPSTCIGKGRFFTKKEFFDKLDEIDSFVFVDMRKRLMEPLTFYEVPVSKVREMYHDENSVMDDKARITKKRFFETFSYEEYGLKL